MNVLLTCNIHRVGRSGTPQASVDLQIWHIVGSLICFITSSVWSRRLPLRAWLFYGGLLTAETHLLLVDRVRDLGSLTKEIKVFPNLLRSGGFGGAIVATAKGILIQVVASLFQLVTQPVIGIFEVDPKISTVSEDTDGRFPSLLTHHHHRLQMVGCA